MKKILFVSLFSIGMFFTNQFFATENVSPEEQQLITMIASTKKVIQTYSDKINSLKPFANRSSAAGKQYILDIFGLERNMIEQKNYGRKLEIELRRLQRRLRKPLTPFSI